MARVQRLVTSGTFSLDGETFDVDNNVWIVGDDHEALVIDGEVGQPLAWVDALTGLLPDLRTLAEQPDDRVAVARVRRTAAEVGESLREAVGRPAPQPAVPLESSG